MAKLGLLAGALAEQAGVRVSGGEMRVILALLPVEVALRIATASRRRRRPATALRYKALHAGPRFDQCPIDREMLVGEQFSHLRQIEHGGKELGGDIPVEQPVPVLAKYRRIPDRLVRQKPDEPAEQQVVVELLHQLPFRAHSIERLQQQRPQQPLRWNRRAAVARVQPVESSRQRLQRRVYQLPDLAQRMTRRNASLQANIAEQLFRSPIFAAHRSPQSKGIKHMHGITLRRPCKLTLAGM